MEIKKVKGTKSYFNKEASKLSNIISKLEEVSKRYGLEKIYLSNLEHASLFQRTIGKETDILQKEMYTFNDKKGREIALKPEGTASIARVVLENKLLENNSKPSYYYISPMYRYERPQKGRQREFYQFGVEFFNKSSLYNELELLLFVEDLLKALKINSLTLNINTIGDFEAREKYNKLLITFLKKHSDSFSSYVQEKISFGNPFRVFDTKNENDLKILNDAPKLEDFLSKESKDKFLNLTKLLNKHQIKYVVNDKLVRGLDYYNDFVFEYVASSEVLGSKTAVIAGGRYDNLISILDNTKKNNAIGLAIGLERLMIISSLEEDDEKIDYYIYGETPFYDEEVTKLAQTLRTKKYNVITDFDSNKKFDKKIKLAKHFKAKSMIIINEKTKKNFVILKNVKTNQSIEVQIEEI